MLEVGFWELVMIGLVALIVVGPEKLPRLARTAGRWVAQARRMAANVRAEIESELAMEEIRRAAQETASPLRDVAEDLRTSTSVPPDYGVASTLRETAEEVRSAVTPPPANPAKPPEEPAAAAAESTATAGGEPTTAEQQADASTRSA